MLIEFSDVNYHGLTLPQKKKTTTTVYFSSKYNTLTNSNTAQPKQNKTAQPSKTHQSKTYLL